MDYLRYWKLLRKPFLFQKEDDFFAGVPQRKALAGLSYFVGSEDNLSMLLCPPENGLSWLLSHAQQMRRIWRPGNRIGRDQKRPI